MTELIEMVKRYQKEKGTEFEPQLILFTLSGCPVCKGITTDLMIDGYAYEEFDCNKDEHSDIADHLEEVLNIQQYPFIFITYPEPKVITVNDLIPGKPTYPQITEHLN